MAIVRAVVAAALAASLVACADDGGDTAPTGPPRTSTAEPSPEVTYLPAGDLPDPLTLRDVDGRTITARPFADFAVASGSGVWVSGVAPGAVRYGDTSGAVTARTPVRGAVTQALEESGDEVYVPTGGPRFALISQSWSDKVFHRRNACQRCIHWMPRAPRLKTMSPSALPASLAKPSPLSCFVRTISMTL